MKQRAVACGVVVLAVATILAGCGPKESPRQRVSRIRQQYEVKPNGFQPRTGADGTPELMLDLLIARHGKDSLDRLTFLVRVEDAKGRVVASKPVTVDVSGLRAGVTQQLTAIAKGVPFADGDSVFLEIEGEPAPAAISEYPEYQGAS